MWINRWSDEYPVVDYARPGTKVMIVASTATTIGKVVRHTGIVTLEWWDGHRCTGIQAYHDYTEVMHFDLSGIKYHQKQWKWKRVISLETSQERASL